MSRKFLTNIDSRLFLMVIKCNIVNQILVDYVERQFAGVNK